jgi:hypothetical protein
MPSSVIALDRAVELTRTGDIWLFRGRSTADRVIRVTTNAPINHVGMAVVIDDLPPLMWHAELGKSLQDIWAGDKHRGVQLHDLKQSVLVWHDRYGQDAWLRQLEPLADKAMEDAVLRTIARMDGLPFPSTTRLATKWLRGRMRTKAKNKLETAYCAEVVAATYQSMQLLPSDRDATWYDPGRFWSGDDLRLSGAYRLADEVAVDVSAAAPR